MTITRAYIETEIVSRLAGLLAAAGMATTAAGSNAALNSAIGWAVRTVGGTVASLSLVTDADVATVADASLDTFLDLAEYRARQAIDGNFAEVDTDVGDLKLKYDQLRRGNERAMARLEARYGATYGLSEDTSLQSGSISLSFQSVVPDAWGS